MRLLALAIVLAALILTFGRPVAVVVGRYVPRYQPGYQGWLSVVRRDTWRGVEQEYRCNPPTSECRWVDRGSAWPWSP